MMSNLMSDKTRVAMLTALIAIVGLLWHPQETKAQWATNGNNINTTNTGNTGVGTSAPAQKLHVNGDVAGEPATSGTTQNGIMRLSQNVGPVVVDLGVGTPGGAGWIQVTNKLDLSQIFPLLLNPNGGNIGIGTNEPTSLLHVNSTAAGYPDMLKLTGSANSAAGATRLRINNVNSSLIANSYNSLAPNLLADSSGLFADSSVGTGTRRLLIGHTGTNAGNDIVFLTNSDWANPRMTVTQAGNVGIGTSTPNQRLGVQGMLGLYPQPWVQPTGRGLFMFHDGAGAAIYAFNYPGGDSDSIDIAAKRIVLSTYIGGNGNPRLTIENNGNVGVGTLTPGYKFDVQGGAINSSGGLCIAGDCKTAWSQVGGGGSSQWTTSGSNIHYNTGNVGIGTATPSQMLHVHGSSNWTGTRVTTAATGATINDGVNFGYDDATGAYVWNREASSLILATNNTERMRVDVNGNVGIGVANAGRKLHVGGAVFSQQTGEVGYHLYNNGQVAEWMIRQPSATSHNLHFTKMVAGVNTDHMVLDTNGNLNVTGTITGGSIEAKYQDVAEWVPTTQKLSAGTVVVLDPERSNHVQASANPYDTKVAGVVSAQPGVILGVAGDDKVMVATTGRVKVRVDATRGPIEVGDILVTSEIEGVAMKSVAVDVGGVLIHRPGTIIGKALEPLAGGVGEILVLLSLQ